MRTIYILCGIAAFRAGHARYRASDPSHRTVLSARNLVLREKLTTSS